MINRKRIPGFAIGDSIRYLFCSDFHIGHRRFNEERLVEDLDEARKTNSRILIGGDVFDLILPGDRKRYRPDSLADWCRGRADVATAQFDYGLRILEPYAHLIDLIMLGNHETAVERHHANDLILWLVRALNEKNKAADVRYGDYAGFQEYTLVRNSNKRRKPSSPDGAHSNRFVIHYHHGHGGTAKVTKGMINFHRRQTFIDSDVIWEGHNHNKIADAGHLRLFCPQSGDEEVSKKQICIMTGCYLNPTESQTHSSVMTDGRKSYYATDWGLAPQDMGGIFLETEVTRAGIVTRIVRM